MSQNRSIFMRPRFYALFVACLAIVIFVTAGVCYIFVRGSIAQYSGVLSLKGLEYPVTIERDSYGIPTIAAENRADLAMATGFTHAQERFFQMDLLRRSSSGELSELFGKAALSFDKDRRFHQLRSVARKTFENMADKERNLIIAYANGVNQGLEALSVRPWEYMLLREKPAKWLPEDTLLSIFVMFFELQDSTGGYDLTRGYMERLLPEEVYTFLTSNGSEWVSALDGSEFPFIPVPDKSEFAYLNDEYDSSSFAELTDPPLRGSNNWALDGSFTGDRGAIVACDMHLKIGVPSIWYRASFTYNVGDEKIRVDGITLPGNPGIILGSNGNVAWGLTNSMVNTTDAIVIDEHRPGYYLTPNGEQPFQKDIEIINVNGEEPVKYEITKTIWGPVLEEPFFGKPVAVQWLAHDPESLNIKFVDLETTKTSQGAIDVSRNVRSPALNFVVGDKNGNIGWTLMGYIPKREGYDGHLPTSLSSGEASWCGALEPEQYPTVYNPPSGMVWTSNNRTTGGEWLEKLGDGGYLNGSRAYQVKKRLSAITTATPQKMLDIQLDDEALFFRRWQGLLLEVLSSEENQRDPNKREAKKIIELWKGYASIDSTAYCMIKSFRDSVAQGVFKRVLSPCFKASKHFDYHIFDYEEPLWIIVSQQPQYLVDPEYSNWGEELSSYVDDILNGYSDSNGHIEWDTITWGARNHLDIRHPLSRAVPLLGWFTDFPSDPASGDTYIPKVSRPDSVASQRMAVIPGREEEGIFHHPCGQSGNPLSPYYRASHDDWLKGRPSPLLPGKTIKTLILNP